MAQRKGIVLVTRGLQVQIAGQVKGHQCSWFVDVLIHCHKFHEFTQKTANAPSGVWVAAQMLLSIGPDIALYPQLE